jgi:hypothetical protein
MAIICLSVFSSNAMSGKENQEYNNLIAKYINQEQEGNQNPINLSPYDVSFIQACLEKQFVLGSEGNLFFVETKKTVRSGERIHVTKASELLRDLSIKMFPGRQDMSVHTIKSLRGQFVKFMQVDVDGKAAEDKKEYYALEAEERAKIACAVMSKPLQDQIAFWKKFCIHQ